MATIDKTYQDLLVKIFADGYKYDDPNRDGVQRIEIMDYTIEHDFNTGGFPAITLKKLAWKSVVGELIWFLRGQTTTHELQKYGVNIWNSDGYKFYRRQMAEKFGIPPLDEETWLSRVKTGEVKGSLGPIYGAQWRDFNGVDQLYNLITELRENPMSTQLIVSSWNASDLPKMALPPCHYEFQIVTRPLKYVERLANYTGPNSTVDLMVTEDQMDEFDTPTHGIKLIWSQRSVDTFLGLPFNIASYAALCYLIARLTNTVPLGIKGNLKNVHLYQNSFKEAHDLTKISAHKYEASQLYVDVPTLHQSTDLDKMLHDLLKPHSFRLEGYESYPAVSVEMLPRDSD
jgi:thymidylate synthase